MKEAQINQIPEVAHNQAMLTFMAERQELIRSREHIQSLEKALEEGQTLNGQLELTLKESRHRFDVLLDAVLGLSGASAPDDLPDAIKKLLMKYQSPDTNEEPNRESEALTRDEMKTICAPVNETGQ